MGPSLATFAYALGILGLFYLDRDKSVRTSRALWIPVAWLWITGSRPVSLWLNGGVVAGPSTVASVMDGSPMDAAVFQLLIAGGAAVVARRWHRSVQVIKANGPVIAYFSFCLISVVWSDFPDISIKRWVKATGDLVMALVVVTDAEPAAAIERVFSRVGFVLLPSSMLLIRYYPNLGRKYDPWFGMQSITGVTTDKNLLGVTAYILTLGALWQVFRLLRASNLPHRSRRLVAQAALLGFGTWILFTANSATSLSCFVLGAMIFLVTGLRRIRGRSSALNKAILTLLVLGCVIEATGIHDVIVQALGRRTDLTGRKEIWPLLIPMAPNALVGAGFESFWLGPRMQKVWDAIPNLYVSEAHNGYIELYLNLGAIGVLLLVLILIHGYRSSLAAFRIDPDLASLALVYVITSAIYGYTEAAFRMLDYAWSFLLLSIAGATCVVTLSGKRGRSGGVSSELGWGSSAPSRTPSNLVSSLFDNSVRVSFKDLSGIRSCDSPVLCKMFGMCLELARQYVKYRVERGVRLWRVSCFSFSPRVLRQLWIQATLRCGVLRSLIRSGRAA